MVSRCAVALLPINKEKRDAKANDSLSWIVMEVLRNERTITDNKDGLLCKRAASNGAMQIIVFKCFKRTVPYRGHCRTLSGYQETRKAYGFLRKGYNWPHRATIVHEFELKSEFRWHHSPPQKHQWWSQLILPIEPLERFELNILILLMRMKQM